MPLPELVTPVYSLTVPSTKKKIKYRPFLVKEQKVLIVAMESQDQQMILDAITQNLKNCILTRTKIDDLALFDIEYIFLQIRARSISEELELKIVCPDDGETEVNVKILVDDIQVDFPKGHINKFKLNDDVTVVMKYPNLEYFTKVNFSNQAVDPYDLVAQCISKVYVGEDDTGSFTFKEARDWVETLTSSQFEDIQTFFNTMPTLRHILKVRNPKTKVENEIPIEGLADFFG
jgi:hypothetical protein|tara:strand:- start:697 stop:1395 length:699 start_codon:yes stop_codon:yes gene_type:complete